MASWQDRIVIQESPLSGAVDEALDLLVQLSMGEQQFKQQEAIRMEERDYRRKEADLATIREKTPLNIYKYGDPFNNPDAYQLIMDDFTDYGDVVKDALTYTATGMPAQTAFRVTGMTDLDITPGALTREDFTIFDEYMHGDPDTYWKGILNMDSISDQDKAMLIERRLLKEGEVPDGEEDWNADMQAKVRERYSWWKPTVMATDQFTPSEEYAELINKNLELTENQVRAMESIPEYKDAYNIVAKYLESGLSTLSMVDPDNPGSMHVGGAVYDNITELSSSKPSIAAVFMMSLPQVVKEWPQISEQVKAEDPLMWDQMNTVVNSYNTRKRFEDQLDIDVLGTVSASRDAMGVLDNINEVQSQLYPLVSKHELAKGQQGYNEVRNEVIQAIFNLQKQYKGLDVIEMFESMSEGYKTGGP